MRRTYLQLGEAAAALLIGGMLVIIFPRYALSILQLVVITVGVAAGLYALAVNVPATGWMSPFRWMSPFGRIVRSGPAPDRSAELRSIHSKLAGWRQPLGGGLSLPLDTISLLKPLIRESLGLDPRDESGWRSAQHRLSPLSWRVLTYDPPRGLDGFIKLPPNQLRVAEVVGAVLDEVDRISSRSGSLSLPRPDKDHD